MGDLVSVVPRIEKRAKWRRRHPVIVPEFGAHIMHGFQQCWINASNARARKRRTFEAQIKRGAKSGRTAFQKNVAAPRSTALTVLDQLDPWRS